MANEILRAKVREVIVRTFELTSLELPERLDADNVDAWDSLGHMALIEEISSVFDVALDHAEVVQMLSEDKIVEVLAAKAGI